MESARKATVQAGMKPAYQKTIVFIVEDLYGGGAEKVLLSTAYQLHKNRHKVHVWLLRDHIEHSIPDGPTYSILPVVSRFTKTVDTPLTRRWQAQQLTHKLKTLAPDLVISCACDKITRYITAFPIYFWIHCAQANPSAKIIRKLQHTYAGKNLICVSQGVQQELLSLGVTPKTSQVIYNSVCPQELAQKADAFIPDITGDFLVCVAALEPRKGHAWLLDAYLKSECSLPLYFIGKGKYRAVLEQRIEQLGLTEDVFFLGYQKNPYPYIKRAKALLLTSRREGLPLVLIESIMLGTPVVAMDCPYGPQEILQTSGLSDYLIPLGDVQGFAEKLTEVTQKPPQITAQTYQDFLPEKAIAQFVALED